MYLVTLLNIEHETPKLGVSALIVMGKQHKMGDVMLTGRGLESMIGQRSRLTIDARVLGQFRNGLYSGQSS